MTLVDFLVWVGVIAIVAVALWALLSQMTLPDPIKKIVTIVGIVLVAIVAIAFLLSMRGGHFSLSWLLPIDAIPRWLPPAPRWPVA